MDILKIVLVGIITVITSIILKQIKPEMSIFISIAGSIVILFMVVDNVVMSFDFFKKLIDKTGVNYGLFKCILKVIGIGYIAEFGAGLCVDSGNSSVADKILFAGKISILCLSMPIINNLIELIIGMMP